MPEGKIVVGEQFSWKPIGTEQFFEAVVTGIRSDLQEGYSPEIQEYAALWIEARPAASGPSQQPFTIMVGTDGKSYMDGKEIAIDV